MATPTESTTTVSGRRCTRTRVRSGSTSSLTSTSQPAATTTSSSTVLTSTTTQAAQQTQSSIAPPPASSSTQGAAQTSTVNAASSAIATSSAIAITPITSSASSQTSAAALPEQSDPSSISSDLSGDEPAQPQSSQTNVPSGGTAGAILPDQGTTGGGNGLTLPADGQTNVASIAGGVVGGFVGIALISALFFFCLRRRKTGTFEKWQQRISEKKQESGGFSAKVKALSEKIKPPPGAAGMFFAKLKGKKTGPASNPYRRHSVRSSVSSVYSVRDNRRSQSISEPPSRFRQQLRGFGDRIPTLKRSKTLLQKKPDSLVAGNNSPFPGIVEDPVVRNSKGTDNPFRDPEEPPNDLLLLNPDIGSTAPQKTHLDGLQDQQRGPITPKPAAMSERGSKDPFASILDELDGRDGSGTPEWLRDTAKSHKRTTSAQTALRSHPPSSNSTASAYYTTENPFFDPSDVPPVPNQPLPPNPPVRPANAYAPLPSFTATSSTLSRDSNMSFFFGEPGPSRPTTNMFSSKVRQSDPFDLDRPEVLGFGTAGGRTVRGSVTRQNSRNRRSSVPNWVNVNDGPYERSSAVPGPLRNPSVKR